jgi:hypothetical protein
VRARTDVFGTNEQSVDPLAIAAERSLLAARRRHWARPVRSLWLLDEHELSHIDVNVHNDTRHLNLAHQHTTTAHDRAKIVITSQSSSAAALTSNTIVLRNFNAN